MQAKPIASSRFRTRSGIATPPHTGPRSRRGMKNAPLCMPTRFEKKLSEDECGAFLVWRPVSLRQHAADHRSGRCAANSGFRVEIIPGITSIQALAARHRISLNEIGEPVHITTGPPADRRAARRRRQRARIARRPVRHSRRWLVTTSTFIGAPIWARRMKSCCPADSVNSAAGSSNCALELGIKRMDHGHLSFAQARSVVMLAAHRSHLTRFGAIPPVDEAQSSRGLPAPRCADESRAVHWGCSSRWPPGCARFKERWTSRSFTRWVSCSLRTTVSRNAASARSARSDRADGGNFLHGGAAISVLADCRGSNFGSWMPAWTAT